MARKTLVGRGIKERIQDILGNGSGSDFTDWSIQASAIENNRRIIKGIVSENSNGKVMSGLRILYDPSGFSLLPGYAFTNSGKVIKLSNPLNYPTGFTVNVSKQIYLKYAEKEVDESDGGHLSESLYSSSPIKIIEDNVGANDDVTDVNEIVRVEDSEDINASEDEVYIGYVKQLSGEEYEIRNKIDEDIEIHKVIRKEILMTGTANNSSSWNNAIFAYNNIESQIDITNFGGVITLPEGKNVIKSIEVNRKVGSTNSMPREEANATNHNNSPENFKARMAIGKVADDGSIGSLTGFGEIELDDTVSGYDINKYDVNYYLDDTIRTIALKTMTTGDESTLSPWDFSSTSGGENNMFYNTGYGPSQVVITIGNLS